ncbi:GNAT family N-acetyltransferase [Nordella sp. HKS 07]|uniref:GNAT family N-acetyltransferase n=1 Tax=Nordella sp. HKS 07 TaxID=2712222 RepID=UPI0013E1A0A1|nr:GNAT family N-acetyltransferase [Nordella sp. HKS 07]QIG48298.1 GNAT family N-acetyltransferase [Nordella sp. HKS 07]
MSDLDLLDLEARTLFVLTSWDRIARENDPDRSAGPRFWLAGCAEGRVARLHHEVSDGVAAEIAASLTQEQPFHEPGALPRFIDRYEALLRGAGLPLVRSLELVHELPHGLDHARGAPLIASGSAEGDRFIAEVERDGMPPHLVDLGVRGIADLWAPWVLLLEAGEVAAMAFAARLGRDGAELGLVTVPKFRGRGFAARVAAAWTHLPELRSRRLFYGADQDNLASKRVITKLGLRRIGVSLRLT